MDEERFILYLRRGGRSPNAIKRCIKLVSEFEDYMAECKNGKQLSEVVDRDLMDFVSFLERGSKTKAKGYLWAIRYYYDFIANDEIRNLATRLRAERVDTRPFLLKNFRSIDQEQLNNLAAIGITNVNQMLKIAVNNEGRERLSREANVPENVILELVKLSDLARIPGIKGVRARLYYDAGLDSVEKIAALEPEELREKIVAFVAESDFDGVPTLPAEARYTVEKARELPRIVEL
jgi:replicative superfamily II helicase